MLLSSIITGKSQIDNVFLFSKENKTEVLNRKDWIFNRVKYLEGEGVLSRDSDSLKVGSMCAWLATCVL